MILYTASTIKKALFQCMLCATKIQGKNQQDLCNNENIFHFLLNQHPNYCHICEYYLADKYNHIFFWLKSYENSSNSLYFICFHSLFLFFSPTFYLIHHHSKNKPFLQYHCSSSCLQNPSWNLRTRSPSPFPCFSICGLVYCGTLVLWQASFLSFHSKIQID